MISMERRTGRDGAHRGLSLLEVVIGVAILTSLALGTVLVLVPVSRQARINREVASANGEARRVLERVHSIPFSKVQEVYPDGIEIPLAALANGKITATYDDPSADPLVMRAVLTWDSPNVGPMIRTFYTIMTR